MEYRYCFRLFIKFEFKSYLIQLSQKVCMLILLLTGQREQSVHLLKVENVIFHKDSLEFQFSVVLKHTRPGVDQDNIRFQSYIQNKSL